MQIHARHVHADPYRKAEHRQPLMMRCRGFDHPTGELIDHRLISLRDWNETVRRHHSIDRMTPTDQPFSGSGLVVAYRNDRLKMQFHLSTADRRRDHGWRDAVTGRSRMRTFLGGGVRGRVGAVLDLVQYGTDTVRARRFLDHGHDPE